MWCLFKCLPMQKGIIKHTGSKPGPHHCRSTILSPWLPRLMNKFANLYPTHTKQKPFKYIFQKLRPTGWNGQTGVYFPSNLHWNSNLNLMTIPYKTLFKIMLKIFMTYFLYGGSLVWHWKVHLYVLSLWWSQTCSINSLRDL